MTIVSVGTREINYDDETGEPFGGVVIPFPFWDDTLTDDDFDEDDDEFYDWDDDEEWEEYWREEDDRLSMAA